jgi:hypothetical protein
MAFQSRHGVNPNEASNTGAGRGREMRTSLISSPSLTFHDVDEPALMLLKAAILALFNG